MHWVYYFGRFLSRIILLTTSDWQVKGKENIPKQGPLLIVCNHLHVVDPPIVAVSIKLKTVIMAKEELYRDRWSRYFVQNFGSFPVRRRGVDREALRLAERWLKQGVFPRGEEKWHHPDAVSLPRLGTDCLTPGCPGSPGEYYRHRETQGAILVAAPPQDNG